MSPFTLASMRTVGSAVERMSSAQRAMFIAGGTDMLQLLQESVVTPDELIDITGLPLTGITLDDRGLRIGAMARMADVAADAQVARHYPALVQALRESASPQVRNMATLGGNLLQRTRCLYFRDTASPCNKRRPGSGCPARDAGSRMNAVLGGSADCVAVYPGDMAVALVALNASVQVMGPDGARTLPIDELHRVPGNTPQRDTNLARHELITDILLPANGMARNSMFMKLRDRATFEWAIASVAVALDVSEGVVRQVRLAVGGVATKPWRLRRVEETLRGCHLDAAQAREAGAAAIADVQPVAGSEFKVRLLQRLVERIILTAGGVA